jgi:site-specific DNA-methyltransferase (adenine-specific)
LRVSKNQIIWGGNYFADLLQPSRGWVCWDKQGDNLSVVNNELAWTSFDIALKMFRRCHGLDKGFMIRSESDKIIHPTQKPISLYSWILQKYAKEGDSILDTHLGSGSIAIACHDMGFDLTAYEIDEEYFAAASSRLKQHQRQLKLFT